MHLSYLCKKPFLAGDLRNRGSVGEPRTRLLPLELLSHHGMISLFLSYFLPPRRTTKIFTQSFSFYSFYNFYLAQKVITADLF
jgi:hypothetical protein